MRFAALDEIDMLVTDAAPRRRTRGGARRRRVWRCRSHDRHPDRQPLPRPHGRPRAAARAWRGAARRVGPRGCGGKGINVARVVAAAGSRPRGPPRSRTTTRSTPPARRGVDAAHVPDAGHVRANVTLTEPDGITTKLNLPGAELDDADAQALVDAVRGVRRRGWLVLAGSLPPGRRRRLLRRRHRARSARAGGAAARSSPSTPPGAALAAVVADGRPDLIKPNDEELAELAGAEPATTLEASPRSPRRRRAARARGVGAALVTLGARGAVLVDADGALAGPAPRSPSPAPSARATARSPATCSPTRGGARRARSPIRRATARPRHPSPARRRRRPPTFRRRRRHRPPLDLNAVTAPPLEVTVSETITPELVSLDVGSARQGGRHPRARAARRRAGPRDRRRRALRRRVGPRGEGRDRPARRHRDPARQVRRRHRAVARLRPPHARASTSAPPTARPTSSSSSRRPRAPPRRTSPCCRSSRAASCRTTSRRRCARRRRTTRSSRSCATRSARGMPRPAPPPRPRPPPPPRPRGHGRPMLHRRRPPRPHRRGHGVRDGHRAHLHGRRRAHRRRARSSASTSTSSRRDRAATRPITAERHRRAPTP